MNLILLRAEEVEDQRAIRLQGRRAEHMLKILRVEEGDTVRVGIINGPIGEALVSGIEGQDVWIEAGFDRLPPPPPPVDIVMALPRPASLKKVLRSAAAMGFRRIDLIRSRRVEKSYFQSPLLEAERLEAELLLGLEQARDTWLPSVNIHTRFRPFVEDYLPHLIEMVQLPLVLHPSEAPTMMQAFAGVNPPGATLLAIGPEGGWTPHEIGALEGAGLKRVQLGERILRVETAMIAAMSQLQLMRDALKVQSKA